MVTARGEPFGRTLIEAMHLGTPVIATRHGGNPEAIEDGRNGFLVDPDDPDDPLLDRLSADEFDLVAVGRALIVDPDWAVKVREGRHDFKPFQRAALGTLY